MDGTVTSMEEAVVAAPSVTVQDVSTLAGSTSTISGISSATSADLTITTLPASGPVRVLKRKQALFVSGDTGAVAALLNLSPSALATVGSKWISVPPSAAPYDAIVKSVSPVGLVQPFLAKVPTSTSLLATPSSPATTVLSGPWTADGTANGWSGLTSLRIDPATSLPKSGLIELHHGQSVATRAAVFSSWSAPLSVELPTVSVSYDNLSA